MKEGYEPVKLEVGLGLCHRIMDSLQDSIDRLDQKGTNSIQHCLDDLSSIVNPTTVSSATFELQND